MELDVALSNLVTGVTKKWARQRKREERSRQAASNRAYVFRHRRATLKDAAYEVIEQAYRKASGDGRYPANARQIMYAARGYIQERTGERLVDNYFTQTLLPAYMEDHRVSWDVVFDARGHFTEPHTGAGVPLGTLAVRRYLQGAAHDEPSEPGIEELRSTFPTKGPVNRYGAVLFIEKEGFDQILAAAHIAERFDLAVMSTKGMSVIASRLLIDRLGVPVFVLHDFDQAGFSILGTLRRSTRRYSFSGQVKVIDLGLTLQDIEQYGLEPEAQRLTQDPSTLRRNGASAADIAFLQGGQRVELNMLSSDELVELIETKLAAAGVGKVIPDPALLASAYRRATQVALLNRAIDAAAEAASTTAAAVELPEDLAAQVQDHLQQHPQAPWDAAVAELADRALDDEHGSAP